MLVSQIFDSSLKLFLLFDSLPYLSSEVVLYNADLLIVKTGGSLYPFKLLPDLKQTIPAVSHLPRETLRTQQLDD